jgi:hypothetical protein
MSLMIMEEGDNWKLAVREKFLPLVQNIVTETELPKSVIETLAIIAFKHPILQSEVIKIRSNKAYEHVALLEEAGYISREKHGRTRKIKLAPKFFEYFDLPPEKVKEAFAGFEAVEKAIQEKEESIKELEVYEEAKEAEEATNKEEPEEEQSVEIQIPDEEPDVEDEPEEPVKDDSEEEQVKEGAVPVRLVEDDTKPVERHIEPQPIDEPPADQEQSHMDTLNKLFSDDKGPAFSSGRGAQGGESPPSTETQETSEPREEKSGTDGIEVFLPDEESKEKGPPKRPEIKPEPEPEPVKDPEVEEHKDKIEGMIEKKADAIMSGKEVEEEKKTKDSLEVAYDQIEDDKKKLNENPQPDPDS